MTDKGHERITGKYVWSSFVKAFDLEKGLIFTIIELTLRPAKAIEDYFNGSRKLFNPIKYAIFGIGFYEIYRFVKGKIYGTGNGDEFDFQHYSLGIVIGIVLVSFTFYLLHHKRGYNFFEYLVATTFTATQIYIFTTLLEIIATVASVFDSIIVILGWFLFILIYIYWVVRSLFRLSIFMTIISIGLSFVSASIYPVLTRKFPYLLEILESVMAFFN